METPHLYDKELSAQGDPSGLAAPAQAETAEKKEGSALGESGAQSGQQADGAGSASASSVSGTAPSGGRPRRRRKKKTWKAKLKRRLFKNTEGNKRGRELLRNLIALKRRVVYTLKYKYRWAVDDKIVVFESYHGAHYNCNPRGIYEAMRQDERYLDYTFVWAFKNPGKYAFLKENLNTVLVRSCSRRHYMFCARAKYLVSNLLLRPQISLKREQCYIQTWHGKPIKKIGCGKTFETDPNRTLKDNYRYFSKNGKRITRLLSPSAFFTPVMAEAFAVDLSRRRDSVVETGYPRNDALYRYTAGQIAEIRERLGIPDGKKVILYAPTWRDRFTDYLAQNQRQTFLRVCDSIDFGRLQRDLGPDYVILFRAHHLDAEAVDLSAYAGFIIDATRYENVNDLLVISDLLISDYSGVIFDFALLRRPMVYYMFDKELYTSELQGVNIDFDDLPGIIVTEEKDLAAAVLKQLREFRYDEKYEAFNRKYSPLDDGYAGQRVIERCMPDNVVKKTLTLQAVRRVCRKRGRVVTRPLKKFCLNLRGILRRAGLIRDKNTRLLKSLENKYAGQRCFLIGNGPSLTPEDLDLIAGELSFGCNMVYKLFDRTKWRPTYHFIVDIIYTKNLYQEITDHVEALMVTHDVAYRAMKEHPEKLVYANVYSQEDYQIRGDMLAYYIPARATVMSFMIEMAMFMGIKEIYLLGTDCTNSFTTGHFTEGYTVSDLDKVNLARARRTLNNPALTLEELGEYRRMRSIMAYEKLAEYAGKHGVKIYNATRGGALEVFPRVALEDAVSRREKDG